MARAATKTIRHLIVLVVCVLRLEGGLLVTSKAPPRSIYTTTGAALTRIPIGLFYGQWHTPLPLMKGVSLRNLGQVVGDFTFLILLWLVKLNPFRKN